MQPNQVLDLDIPTLQACIEGYQDHLFDLKCLAIMQGYWAGYYGNSKKPKPLSQVLSAINREHQNAKKSKHQHTQKPGLDVDVDAFLAKERRRLRVKTK